MKKYENLYAGMNGRYLVGDVDLDKMENLLIILVVHWFPLFFKGCTPKGF